MPSALSLPAAACFPRLQKPADAFETENSRALFTPCLLQHAQGQAAPKLPSRSRCALPRPAGANGKVLEDLGARSSKAEPRVSPLCSFSLVSVAPGGGRCGLLPRRAVF